MNGKWLTFLLALAVVFPSWAEERAERAPEAAPEAAVVRPGPRVGQYRYLTVGGLRYTILNEPHTTSQTALFDPLSPEEQQRFRKRQMGFLSKLARVLHWSRLGLGTGAVVVDKIFQSLPTREQLGNPIRAVREVFRKNEDVHEVKAQPNAHGNGSVSSRGKRVAQAILNFANQQMWDHAPVVARNNEHSLLVMIGGGGGVGVNESSTYAEAVLGLKLGYNHERQALAFQVFGDVEKMRFVFPLLVRIPNFGIKAGVSIAQVPKEEAGQKSRPTGRYPPGPVEIIGSPKEMNIVATLGIGIPPFNTFAYMETDVNRNPLIHLEMGRQGILVRGRFAKGLKQLGTQGIRLLTALPKLPVRLVRWIGCLGAFGRIGGER